MKNRPERLISFLVVWLTMFSCIWASGQIPVLRAPERDFLQLKYPGDPEGHLLSGLYSGEAEKWSTVQIFDYKPTEVNSYYRVDPFPGPGGNPGTAYAQRPDLYYIQSGFFCKREWELEKAVHIPFRFRLGSLADCNAIEGKR
jgi:hypothetical protein